PPVPSPTTPIQTSNPVVTTSVQTSTPAPSSNPYGGPAALFLSDPLTSAGTSLWANVDNGGHGCALAPHRYHGRTANYYFECHGYKTTMDDLTIEVHATFISSSSGFGITLRDDNSGGRYYAVELDKDSVVIRSVGPTNQEQHATFTNASQHTFAVTLVGSKI